MCAQDARTQLDLDVVVLMPTGIPPHKEAPDDPGAPERFALCELAVAGAECLSVSRLELDRPGRSYTVDTLRAVHERDPEDELTFIAGGDIALGLAEWREPEAVISLAQIAVASRGDATRAAIEERVKSLPGARERLAFFDMPRIDISSSLVRRRVASGRPIRHLVPDAVAARIQAQGLYRGALA